MKQKLNLNTWNRKAHYDFFSKMDEPFFGVTTQIDCTIAYNKAKILGIPFFSYYLHKTLVAVNTIENFRYRIVDGEVYIFDYIDASTTVLRDDTTFGFSLINYHIDLAVFSQNALLEVNRVKAASGLFTRDFPVINLIHLSVLPWVDFTSFSHARKFDFNDSCPKITFGKMIDIDGKKTMPMSVQVHHALIDGYHLGEFVSLFQELMNVA